MLALLTLYTALALELEDSKGYAVLPLFRRGDASLATRHDIGAQVKGLAAKPGSAPNCEPGPKSHRVQSIHTRGPTTT